MSWFRRKNDVAYLESTQTVSRPVGIVMSVLTVLVIGAAVFSLFLGGRWLYNNLDGSNESKDENVSLDVTATSPESTDNKGTSGGTTTDSGSQTTSGGGEASSSSNNSAAGTGSGTTSSGSSGSSQTTGSTNTGATTTTTSGAQNNQSAAEIPATGPVDTLAIFIIAATLGTGVHALVSRKYHIK